MMLQDWGLLIAWFIVLAIGLGILLGVVATYSGLTAGFIM
jgi:hypothetical protein